MVVVVVVVVVVVLVLVDTLTTNLGFSSVIRISSGFVISLILMPDGLSLPTADGGSSELLLLLLTTTVAVVNDDGVELGLSDSSSVLSEELFSL